MVVIVMWRGKKSVQNKSALTDHAGYLNRVIDWPESTILDRESDRGTRWIKEAVHLRKEGRRSMNRDEGSYTLRAPGIVPCIISFSKQLPCFLMVWP